MELLLLLMAIKVKPSRTLSPKYLSVWIDHVCHFP